MFPLVRVSRLRGRSGCGKSTLLATLGLLRRPSSGRLWLAGEDVTSVSDGHGPPALRNSLVGFVFQDYSLVSHLSVLDNVLLPIEYGARISRRTARRAALAQLDAVGLGGFERRQPAAGSPEASSSAWQSRALSCADRSSSWPTSRLERSTW